MFCKNCGQKIDDNADICIHCGVATDKNNSSISSLDNPSHLPGILGCCFPIVGIILYFVWKDNKPLSAKLVIKWTLAGLAINIIFTIIYVLIAVLENA
jgi:uncharacterized membrane protein YvbJ